MAIIPFELPWLGQPRLPTPTRRHSGVLVYGDEFSGVDRGIWTPVNNPGLVTGDADRALQFTAASTQYVRQPVISFTSTEQTLWAVARIRNWTPANSLVSLGASGSSDYTLLYTAAGTISMASVSGATVGQAQTGAAYSDTTRYGVFVGRVSGSSFRDVWYNGVLLVDNLTAVTPATPVMATVGTAWVSGAGASYATADIAAAGALPFVLTDGEVIELSRIEWTNGGGRSYLSNYVDMLLTKRTHYAITPPTAAAFNPAWARNSNSVIQRAL